MTQPVEIALVGCGAIAQRGYLPALNLVPDVRCLWLVDVNRRLAENLASRFGIPNSTDNYLPVLDQVEAVILAVPTHLHARMAHEALDRGKAVLCEKPLGRTTEEVRGMLAVSERAGLPLVPGMIFRQYPGLQQIQAALLWDVLGTLREVRASYGNPLDWPVSSVSFFDREIAGGGVLLDLGIHVIDSLFWVLSLEEASVTQYCDDGESGMEAEAKAHLTIRLAENRGSVPCLFEVSRLRRLKNCIEILGEKESLIMPLSSSLAPRLRKGGGSKLALAQSVSARTEIECFGEQIKAFVRRLRGLEANCATGESQIHVLKIIESCYAVRKPLALSWQKYGSWN
jgi:predicted dehydrogenase